MIERFHDRRRPRKNLRTSWYEPKSREPAIIIQNCKEGIDKTTQEMKECMMVWVISRVIDLIE